MKKIIIILLTCLCICENIRYRINAIGDFKPVLENNVEGQIGSTITQQQVKITFNDANAKFVPTAFTTRQDISSWFSFPTGCLYKAEVNSVTDTQLLVDFNGSIDSTALEGETPIEITIPYTPDDEGTTEVNEEVYYVTYDSNPYIADIDDVDNTKAKYIITDSSFNIQYDGPYEISGTVGEVLTPQIVRVEITDGIDEFDLGIENVTLPVVNGLTPTVIELDPSGLLITIEYTGTPLSPSQDLIHTTILKENMLLQAVDRVVPDRADVKFNIVPKYVPTPPSNNTKDDVVYTPPVTGID